MADFKLEKLGCLLIGRLTLNNDTEQLCEIDPQPIDVEVEPVPLPSPPPPNQTVKLEYSGEQGERNGTTIHIFEYNLKSTGGLIGKYKFKGAACFIKQGVMNPLSAPDETVPIVVNCPPAPQGDTTLG